jgi:hypothetical protein
MKGDIDIFSKKTIYFGASFIFLLVLIIFISSRTYDYSAGMIKNEDRGELVLWSSNHQNMTGGIPEGFYLSDFSPRSLENQTLGFNQTLNCIDYKTNSSNNSGFLFITGLYPTTDSIIDLEIGIDENVKSESCIITNNFFGLIRKINETYYVYSIWYNSRQLPNYKFLKIDANITTHNKINISIISDGCKRTNIIKYNDSLYIDTPYTESTSRDLPYTFLNFPIILIYNKVFYQNDSCILHIYKIDQKIPRRIITPHGTKTKTAFGIDGPHELSTITNGINYMNNMGYVGTVWVDTKYLNINNIEFIKNLLNNGWELGIHYSAELSNLNLKEALALMDSDHKIISDIFLIQPTSWCSLRNRDNITHAIYAYNKLGMIWRNGVAGVNYFPNVGNLDNSTWNWWNLSSDYSAIYPSFSHRLDEEPAINYSIDSSKFKRFIKNYSNKNIQIIGFNNFYKRSINQKETNITILEKRGNYIKFFVKTNGYPCDVNVFLENRSESISLIDLNLNKKICYSLNDDRSVTFEASNNHTYNLLYINIKLVPDLIYV